MDVAKAIAVLATNPGGCRDYFGSDKYTTPNLAVACVPTTAGTGSEVTPYSVITDLELGMKRTLSGRSLFPAVAVLDPALTLTVPRDVTVNTGLDVLSQAMEGIVSRTSTAVGDALALEACRLVRRWLPECVRDGNDLEARSQMLQASMLAGCVIAQSGTTLVHGMGYYFTTRFGVPHGLANGLVVPPTTLAGLDKSLTAEAKNQRYVYSIAAAANTKSLSANGQASLFWDYELVRGRKIAPIAGSMTGSPKVPMGQPLTYVFAEEKSVRGILDGMRAGRTFVTAGPDAPTVSLDADVLENGRIDAGMGGAIPAGQKATLIVSVMNAKGKKVEVLENGHTMLVKNLDNDKATLKTHILPD